MASTTASTSVWFGGLAAAVQGGWQAMAATGHEKKPMRACSGEQKQETAAAVAESATAGRKAAEDVDVGRCVGAMSTPQSTFWLDRFAPS
ncbi:hypothetical protein HU200_011481 [Digitaria exilis]|uniref:Uncharacterized protein n=1 Tax=Digitaria exilis TaxID=1010633 RepID=A0A835KP21_9POAL|nr:hypothetical protein HU200_011481 [Digitaria exilis]